MLTPPPQLEALCREGSRPRPSPPKSKQDVHVTQAEGSAASPPTVITLLLPFSLKYERSGKAGASLRPVAQLPPQSLLPRMSPCLPSSPIPASSRPELATALFQWRMTGSHLGLLPALLLFSPTLVPHTMAWLSPARLLPLCILHSPHRPGDCIITTPQLCPEKAWEQ